MAQRPKQRCTMRDVARAAGVSVATVSRALSDSPLIPRVTRRKIQRTALRLRYSPRIAAISLRGGRAPVVGIFTALNEGSWPSQHILWGLSEEINRTRHHMVIYPSESFPGTRRRFEQIIDEGILGSIVVVGHPVISEAPLQRALDWGIPVVTLEYQLDRAHSVRVDGLAGGRLAAERLALTCGKFTAVLPRSRDPLALERLRGFREELARRGLEGGLDHEDVVSTAMAGAGEDLGRRLALTREERRGFFCTWGDLTVLGMIRSLKVRGFAAGQDYRVLGYDDLTFARYFRPGITTIRQPLEEMGRSAANLAIQAMKDPSMKPQHRVLRPELVVRDTA